MGYVHVSVLLIQHATKMELLVFMGCSIALKLAMQELAKCALLRQQRAKARRQQARPPNKYAMMLLIATPTILIEIQVRSALLQVGSASVTVMGSLLLGVMEVVVRLVKVLVVQRAVDRRAVVTAIRKITIKTHAHVSQPQQSRYRSQQAVTSPTLPPGRLVSGCLENNVCRSDGVNSRHDRQHEQGQAQSMHRQQQGADSSTGVDPSRNKELLVFHATETHADMYAEYLAMGCSYATLVIFDDHPHYRFQRDNGAAGTSNDWRVFALQVGVEVVVDAVACVLEMSLGVEFQAFSQNNGALLLTVATLVFANMAICARLYVDA